ncbi:MAG: NAD(P)H-dependent oxidoreductase [Candidatus Omnitrophota bacterium]
MKNLIVYYSYSGNTRKIAEILAEYLGGAEIIELKCLEEITSFIGQARKAFWHKKSEIMDVKLDLKEYDLICLGTPVWAFGPAPAMNMFLDKCLGVDNKKIVLFSTYGSGVGKDRCLNYMQSVLAKKKASEFKRFSIQQANVKDREVVISKIKEVLPLSLNG